MVKRISKPSRKKNVLIILILVLILSGAVLAYSKLKNGRNDTDRRDLDALTGEAINYGPPSDEEIRTGEQPQNQPTDDFPETPTENKAKVYPIISTWTQDRDSKNLFINGFVPSIVEADGICQLTLQKDGQAKTQSKDARPDAQTTTCGVLEIAYSDLSKGTWDATLTYSSSLSSGTSETVRIEVQ